MIVSGCRRGSPSRSTGMPTCRILLPTHSRSDRAAMAQMTLADLNACSRAEFVAALGNIFEHSPWIAEAAAAERPFAGIGSLFAAMKEAVDHAPQERRLAL